MVSISGRLLDIVSGKTHLPDAVVRQYIAAVSARGLSIDEDVNSAVSQTQTQKKPRGCGKCRSKEA
jgi:hypothetical protein